MNKTIKYLAMFVMIVSLAVIYPTIGYSKPGGGGGKPPKDGGGENAPKNAFNIMMNYELGMHCTGFEFAYCCVLPPYNSIITQIVKTQKGSNQPKLLEGDPNAGLDLLDRPTVLRDPALDDDGNFKKYVMRYWHDAQPRSGQSSTLISNVEGNSLLMWNTIFDAATLTTGPGTLGPLSKYAGTAGDSYNGAGGVLKGDGVQTSVGLFGNSVDNYWNAAWNHLYIYVDPAHPTPAGPNLEGKGGNPGAAQNEDEKIRLGIHVDYPTNTGAALHPMGPDETATDGSGATWEDGPGTFGFFPNVLTWSTDHGTVVYTQSKTVENIPVMLTSPRVWEALGLPLTPFEDTIGFFGNYGNIDEDVVRPYVEMKAQLHNYDPAEFGGVGSAVLDDGTPVIGMGTAPIDIPNCERCHALGDGDSNNSAQNGRPAVASLVAQEKAFWISNNPGPSDWYPRLKAAAISILAIHDDDHGTNFLGNYNPASTDNNASTRLGHETVICQRCHADNVIAVVTSATCSDDNPACASGTLIPPLTEAIHWNHKDNEFSDSQGRNGGCQGCHPAHRSDGSLAGYPIDEVGMNTYSAGDNRDAAGGCYVGRDVHSNPGRNTDGAETPSHMNAVGQWLVDNVSSDGASGPDNAGKGIWCTNCHTQLSQELWKVDDCDNMITGDCITNARDEATLADVAAAVGTTEAQAIAWLDPKTNDDTAAIWAPDPGLCDYLEGYFTGTLNTKPFHDAAIATIEVNVIGGTECSTGQGTGLISCGGSVPDFSICNQAGAEAGELVVNILTFDTTPGGVSAAQASLTGSGQAAVAVPFSAGTDGRDHWLSAGEPHCADCHAAPYTEASGHQTRTGNPYPPFNYPQKSSLFRYSRGHQDITCQGCHESIHGLYPVTPLIDTTSYAQAAGMNTDGSHGPLKCGACHDSNDAGVNKDTARIYYDGAPIGQNFDAAVSWMHTYTDLADPRDSICLRCHDDNSADVASDNGKWNSHGKQGRASRLSMDKVEKLINEENGIGAYVNEDPNNPNIVADPLNTICTSCHGDRERNLSKKGCSSKWKKHLTEGRTSEVVWEYVSETVLGETCGW